VGSRSGAALALALALMLVLAGCGGAAAGDRGGPVLRIAAAADLRFALEEVLTAYRDAHPEVGVRVSYGSSGTLFSQLENEAPFDVYLSADVSYPERLASEGLVAPEGVFTYAVGRIVVWVPDGSPIDVERLGLRALLDPAVRTVAIANPEHAPYGRAAVAAMRSAGVYGRVEDRLVLGENVAQAAQFVQTGAADIGIIPLALALAPGAGGRWSEIPADAHPPIVQGGAILRWASDPEAARAFVDVLLGPAGREALRRYGFEEPP
jgi:molybdate transport system substrate-binding protein